MKSLHYSKLSAIEPYLLVALGGSAGASMRFLVYKAVSSPFSTFAVNMIGSFLLGFLMYQEIYIGGLSARSRVFLAVGFFGSFTTFSTFIYEAFSLTNLYALIYVTLSLTLGFASVYLGRTFAAYIARGD